MQIRLRAIDGSNWRQAIRLKVADHQANWVAPNAFSLLQAHYEGGTVRAIYADEVMVGFVYYLSEDGRWWICRLMMDAAEQGKGYGRAALPLIVAEMRENPACKDVHISFVPGNDVARDLYLSVGFQDTGEIIDGEIVFVLPG